MHCIIQANGKEDLPSALLPVKGRAVIDYLIDDALKQKDITAISVVTTYKSLTIFNKHLKNAFPNNDIRVRDTIPMDVRDDIIFLQGNVYTSLKLQDFIRFYKQFKMITNAVYDGMAIPFYIIPKQKLPLIFTYLQKNDTDAPDTFISWAVQNDIVNVFNIGTGYYHDIRTNEEYGKLKEKRG